MMSSIFLPNLSNFEGMVFIKGGGKMDPSLPLPHPPPTYYLNKEVCLHPFPFPSFPSIFCYPNIALEYYYISRFFILRWRYRINKGFTALANSLIQVGVKMPNERQQSDSFDIFGGFGNFGDFGGSIFGKNPFDDPFFTRPFGSIFHSNSSLRESPLVVPPSGPTIKELCSDDEVEMEDNDEESQNASRPANEPFVDHPDDEADDNKKQVNYRTDNNWNGGGSQAQSFKVHSCKVTYGGVDGVYYTSSASRRMGSDGMIMEDCKEADKRTGEATHRISRGLHDKGHTVTRKLNSDGKVDMRQTLHNLNEDELGSFEDAWKGNAGKHLPPGTGSSGIGANRMSDWGVFHLPSTRHRVGDAWGSRPNNEKAADTSKGQTKKVIRIPID